MPPPITAFAVRQAVLEAGVTAVERRAQPPRSARDDRPGLPHLDHPELGPLTGSTADFDRDGVRQTGHKPGTVGQPLPGVALRVVDGKAMRWPPEASGRLLAPGSGDDAAWTDTGWVGSIDREGFVRIEKRGARGTEEPDQQRGRSGSARSSSVAGGVRILHRPKAEAHAGGQPQRVR